MRLVSILTVIVIAVGAATPALAQSAETCVKYMEADSVYTENRIAAQKNYDDSIKEFSKTFNIAYKIHDETRGKLQKKQFGVFEIATARREAIISRAKKRRMKQIRDGKPTFDISTKQFEIAKKHAREEFRKIENIENAKIKAEREAAASKLDVAKSAYKNAVVPFDAVLKDAQQKNAAARVRAYLKAYKGPTSENANVMSKLLSADRLRCKRRFE